MVHASLDTPLGPAVDVYACALVILQCFRGGRPLELSPAYAMFQLAVAVWISDGCPHIQGEFYLLAALHNLMTASEPSLSGIEEEHPDVFPQVLFQ